MKLLLSGNEAIARGAYEAGVEIAAAYPGTPSTEILENVVKYPEIYAEWSVNEKVAFEVALGGALAGKRALAAMKHVGVNVAADALMTACLTGVNRGFVIITADDPGMHSSQNEQDNRVYAKFAKIPMLEPSNSQEAKEFTKLAFELSEKYDTPVLLRMTTRVCHGKGIVDLHERLSLEPGQFEKNPQKFVMIPAYARKRHEVVMTRLQQLETCAETCPMNRVEMRDAEIGVVTSGISYQYTREALPKASIFKLGMSFPLPLQSLKKFAQSVKTLYVIEELEPIFEEQMQAAGIAVIGKECFPRTGELSPETIRACLKTSSNIPAPVADLPNRPPVMCAGCPHRGMFHILKKLKVVVSGDIGCYTLSALPPLAAMDTCVCMGASVGIAQGLQHAGTSKKPVVGVLGDSTFLHSGIPGLVNAVYNQSNITLIILDNRITAMTGHQENPGTGRTLRGEATHSLDFAALARAVGVTHVSEINPLDLKATEAALRSALEFSGPAVVIAREPCVLIEKGKVRERFRIDPAVCIRCKLCLRIGCPAISLKNDVVSIDPLQCTGCGLCAQVCTSGAIMKEMAE